MSGESRLEASRGETRRSGARVRVIPTGSRPARGAAPRMAAGTLSGSPHIPVAREVEGGAGSQHGAPEWSRRLRARSPDSGKKRDWTEWGHARPTTGESAAPARSRGPEGHPPLAPRRTGSPYIRAEASSLLFLVLLDSPEPRRGRLPSRVADNKPRSGERVMLLEKPSCRTPLRS